VLCEPIIYFLGRSGIWPFHNHVIKRPSLVHAPSRMNLPSYLRSIALLSHLCLGLPSALSSRCPHQSPMWIFVFFHTYYIPCQSHEPFYSVTRISYEEYNPETTYCKFSPLSCQFVSDWSILALYSRIPPACIFATVDTFWTKCGHCGDWLGTGTPGFDCWQEQTFFFITECRPIVGPASPHTATRVMDTGGCFFRSKAVRAWRSPTVKNVL
jgi:hypothetical protein